MIVDKRSEQVVEGLCPMCGCNDTSVDWTKRDGYLVINGRKVGGIERYRHCNNEQCRARFRSVEVATSMVRARKGKMSR